MLRSLSQCVRSRPRCPPVLSTRGLSTCLAASSRPAGTDRTAGPVSGPRSPTRTRRTRPSTPAPARTPRSRTGWGRPTTGGRTRRWSLMGTLAWKEAVRASLTIILLFLFFSKSFSALHCSLFSSLNDSLQKSDIKL